MRLAGCQVTFPASVAQLPHPVLQGEGLPRGTRFDVDYHEGAAVGYKWFEKNGHQPLFAFGHGLSYGSFAYEQLNSTLQGDRVSVSFKVKNTSARVASAVPQVYVSPAGGGWEAPRRLGGFAKLSLQPGESRTVSISIDPRLLARFEVSDQTWRIAPGDYRIQLGASSVDVRLTSTLRLAGAAFDVRGAAR